MSIEEKDPSNSTESATQDFSKALQEQAFVRRFSNSPDANLAKPFGTPNWALLAPTLLCTALAFMLFTRLVNLGKATLNWNIIFNVNLAAGIVVVLLGAIILVPKIVKNPSELRNQSTLTAIGLLLLVALFFWLRIADLGTFNYTLDRLEISAALGLGFIGGLIVVALRGGKIAMGVLAAYFLWWGFSIDTFGFSTVVDLFTSENGGRLLRALTPPNWTYFNKIIDPMLLTVQTAVAATVIGMVLALPLSILAARNTTPHPVIYNIVRFIVNTLRAIPSLILALILIPFVGLGPGAGVLGLGLHSASVLTKLYAEAFESVKPQPLEALNAVGANGLKSFRWGIFPQAFPLVASYSIFNWESNGRDSTVVAFVGGGGIGFLLQANLSLLDYANVAVILVTLIVTVTILDRFSDFVRSKIL
jgi:phosphonate ABC transporter permease subunit PhnE